MTQLDDSGLSPAHQSVREAKIRQFLRHALVSFFIEEGYEIRGAVGVPPYPPSPTIANDGYGSGRPRAPQVLGWDIARRRIVFGLVRESRWKLDSEDSLEEYNVFLDHNAKMGEQASLLVVAMPEELLTEFTSLITHYIHREYWHRVVPIGSRLEHTLSDGGDPPPPPDAPGI